LLAAADALESLLAHASETTVDRDPALRAGRAALAEARVALAEGAAAERLDAAERALARGVSMVHPGSPAWRLAERRLEAARAAGADLGRLSSHAGAEHDAGG
jgi:hypothetical protein